MVVTWPSMFYTTHCTVCESWVGYSISRNTSFCITISTITEGIDLCWAVIRKSRSGSVYSICTKSGDYLLAAVRPMCTFTLLTCECNVTWTGPRISAKSSSALILPLVNFVVGWLLWFEFFADTNFTGAVVTWRWPSLNEFFARKLKYTAELLSSHLSQFNAEVNWSRVVTVRLITERGILYSENPHTVDCCN